MRDTSTNPFNDDGSDDEYTDEAVEKMLEDMDIDTDFNCWSSFRASVVIKKKALEGTSSAASGDGATIAEKDEDDPLTECEQAYINKWATRVHRDQVYSTSYLPVPRETREVQDLAHFLGLSGKEASEGAAAKGGGSLSLLGIHKKSTNTLEEKTAESRLLFPVAGEPKSMLLKREPVLLGGEERELILLSRGIIIATPQLENSNSSTKNTGSAAPIVAKGGSVGSAAVAKIRGGLESPAAFLKKNLVKPGLNLVKPGLNLVKPGLDLVKPGLARISSGMAKKFIRRNFESAEMLSSIMSVEDMKQNSFAILINGGGKESRYVFTCAKLPQKKAWLNALTRAVAQTKLQQQNIQHELDKLELFGGAATPAGKGKHDNARHSADAVHGVVSRNMAGLQERGDRLDRLHNKTANLQQDAADYRDMARQLKEKAKKQSIFGI